jgi:hypothetical protein
LKAPDKQLGVKTNLCHRPGVKSKASTKFIEKIGEHPDGILEPQKVIVFGNNAFTDTIRQGLR